MKTIEELKNTVIQGDCLEVMKTLPENSVDSIVTDPPYELGFMGKSWDNTGIANNKDMWTECLRVLKPGGHLLAFSGTRTYHRMASAIEDAGFEVRDMVEWVYGSGFPKSLNIGKAVDKLQGNERDVVGKKIDISTGRPMSAKQAKAGNGKNINEGWDRPWRSDDKHCEDMTLLTKGTSEWEGWGTALKPAHEPICMARKPLAEKTVAENCLKYGTGGINIDESRVAANWKEERPESWFNSGKSKSGNPTFDGNLKSLTESTVGERLHDDGRFPANLIHDNSEEVRECFPETNASKSANRGLQHSGRHGGLADIGGNIKYGTDTVRGHNDNGGNASRFFKSIIYQAKASKSERNKGCEGLEEKEGIRTNAPRENEDVKTPTRANNHPTVKPIVLMEYLIKMVTPKGGIVLDPFAGSGTTGVACKNLNRNYILIEKEPEYVKICNERLTKTNN